MTGPLHIAPSLSPAELLPASSDGASQSLVAERIGATRPQIASPPVEDHRRDAAAKAARHRDLLPTGSLAS